MMKATDHQRFSLNVSSSSQHFLNEKCRGLLNRKKRGSTASRCALKRKHSRSTPQLLLSDFSIDVSESSLTHSNDDFSALSSSQLKQVRENKEITRLKLNKFVQKFNQTSFVEIKDLLSRDDRTWKSIKFVDTVPGSNYRRWMFKKESLCRRLESLEDDLGIDVLFSTRVEISFDEMTKESIFALLHTLQQDLDVTTLAFSGNINAEDMEHIVSAISALMSLEDGRTWDGIVFHASFGGKSSDHATWCNATRRCGRRLEQLSADHCIPVGFKALQKQQ